MQLISRYSTVTACIILLLQEKALPRAYILFPSPRLLKKHKSPPPYSPYAKPRKCMLSRG
jgi:hypothetical protein